MALETHRSFFKQVPEILSKLQENDKPTFGAMNATEMVDHLLAGTNLLMSKMDTPLETPEDLLPKFKAFLMSDRGFKPGANKPEAYSQYEGSSQSNLAQLKSDLYKALAEFDLITSTEDDFWSAHPSFGKLNAEETRQLQYKHLRHHFAQFGLL